MQEKIHQILNTIPFCYVDIPVYEGEFFMGKIIYVGKFGDCVLIKDSYGEIFSIQAFPNDVLNSLYQQIYTYLN